MPVGSAAVLLVALLAGLPARAHPAPPTTPGDDQIVHWLESALRSDARIGGASLGVRSSAGIVTLYGTVTDLAASRYAELEAMKVAGVVGVVNVIEVLPVARTDDEIVADVRRRLSDSVEVADLGIEVGAARGTVTLTGTTDSLEQVRQAALLAGEVRGVKAVDDRLVVDFRSERSDRRIENDIVSSIARDAYLSGLPIHVGVRTGVVRLTGKVGSLAERERAVLDARLVFNVEDVIDRLEIDPAITPETRQSYLIPGDDELRSALLAEFEADPRVDPASIRVETSSGLVTLRGAVPTWHQRQIAELDALDVVGVVQVLNRLRVDAVPRLDEAVRDDVEARLRSDFLLAHLGISVGVEAGTVSLTGRVNSFYESRHAVESLSGIAGVRSVDDRLEVVGAPPASSLLREQVETRLFANWSTRRVADRIRVEVEGRNVTLAGQVDNWSEYREAQRLALRTRDVAAVTNELVVVGKRRAESGAS